MSRKGGILIGVDGNEANLTQNRVGSNQAVFGLLNGLYTVDQSNRYIIYLSTPPMSDMPTPRKNWQYRIIPPPKFWTQWRLPADLFLNKPRPDVFLSPSHYAPRFSPVPYVVIVADLGYLKFPQFYTKKDYWQLKSWSEYSIKRSARIISVSQTTKKDIIEFYNIPPSKISVVYHGYDKSRFHKNYSESKIKRVLKKYNITQPYILFIGSLRPTKNIERLIEAFGLLNDEQTALVLVGKKGWMYTSIFEKIKMLKLEKKIIFPGFVPDEDLPYLISSAVVFTLPSLYEGFGIPIIEAMACGVPTVISNISSLLEISQAASVYVNPYSVKDIAKGINVAIEKHDELISKGFKRINHFDWKISAKKVINVLEESVRA